MIGISTRTVSVARLGSGLGSGFRMGDVGWIGVLLVGFKGSESGPMLKSKVGTIGQGP